MAESKVITGGKVLGLDNQFAPGKPAKGGGDGYVSPSKSNDITTKSNSSLEMPKGGGDYCAPGSTTIKGSKGKAK